MNFIPISNDLSPVQSPIYSPIKRQSNSPSIKKYLWDPHKDLTSPIARTRYITLQAHNQTLQEFSSLEFKQKSYYEALLENDQAFFEAKVQSFVQKKQLSPGALQFHPSLLQSIITLKLQPTTIYINQLLKVEQLFYSRLQRNATTFEIHCFYTFFFATSPAKQIPKEHILKTFQELLKLAAAEGFVKSLLHSSTELVSTDLLTNMLLHLDLLFYQKSNSLLIKDQQITCFAFLLSQGWTDRFSKGSICYYFSRAKTHKLLESVLPTFFFSEQALSIPKETLVFYLQQACNQNYCNLLLRTLLSVHCTIDLTAGDLFSFFTTLTSFCFSKEPPTEEMCRSFHTLFSHPKTKEWSLEQLQTAETLLMQKAFTPEDLGDLCLALASCLALHKDELSQERLSLFLLTSCRQISSTSIGLFLDHSLFASFSPEKKMELMLFLIKHPQFLQNCRQSVEKFQTYLKLLQMPHTLSSSHRQTIYLALADLVKELNFPLNKLKIFATNAGGHLVPPDFEVFLEHQAFLPLSQETKKELLTIYCFLNSWDTNNNNRSRSSNSSINSSFSL